MLYNSRAVKGPRVGGIAANSKDLVLDNSPLLDPSFLVGDNTYTANVYML